MIQKDIFISIQPTPQDIALEFSDFSTEDYIEFFNEFGHIIHNVRKSNFKDRAMEFIKSDDLTIEARMVLQSLSQHYFKAIDIEKEKIAYQD